MAFDETQRTVLEIVIKARSEMAALQASAAQVSSFGATLRTAGTLMLGAGAAATGLTVGLGTITGALVKSGAEWEAATQALANNTNMGAAGLANMRTASMQLADQTGQDALRIAEGYMYVSNHAYAGAAAANILAAATKNAAATQGDAADNANLLAGVLREYNVSAAALATNTGLATRSMDVLHNAVANSNFTMKDFVEGGKRAIAQAGAFGVPLSQVSAQLAVLSEHGFPSAEVAGLNWAGMLRSLEAPTKAAQKGMEALHQATGVDLLADVQKLGKDGAFLPQFLADIATATGGDFTKMMQLMPRASYAQALSALVRNQPQLTDVQRLTRAAEAGQVVPGMTGTNEAFAAQQTTVLGKLADMRQQAVDTAKVLGTALLPVMDDLLAHIRPVISEVNLWVRAHADLLAHALPLATGLTAVAGAALLVGGAATLVLATLNPLSIALMALTVAGAALAAAWATNWGGMRDTLASAWSAIQPALETIRYGVGAIVTDFQTMPLGDALAASWGIVEAGLGRAVGWMQSTALPALRTAAGQWATALGTWASQVWTQMQPALRAVGAQIIGWINGFTATITANTDAWAAALTAWIAPAAAGVPGQMNTWTDALTAWLNSDGAQAVSRLGDALARLFDAAFEDALKQGLQASMKWALGQAGSMVPFMPALKFPGLDLVPAGLGQAAAQAAGLTPAPPETTFSHPPGSAVAEQSRATRQQTDALTALAQAARVAQGFATPLLGGASTVAREMSNQRALADARAAAVLSDMQRAIRAAHEGAGPAMVPAGLASTFSATGAQTTTSVPTTTTTGGTTGLASLLGGAGGTGGGGTTVNISVSVGAGAVRVETTSGGGGDAQSRDYGRKVGEAIADALATFAQAERMVSDPIRPFLTGAHR